MINDDALNLTGAQPNRVSIEESNDRTEFLLSEPSNQMQPAEEDPDERN